MMKKGAAKCKMVETALDFLLNLWYNVPIKTERTPP